MGEPLPGVLGAPILRAEQQASEVSLLGPAVTEADRLARPKEAEECPRTASMASA